MLILTRLTSAHGSESLAVTPKHALFLLSPSMLGGSDRSIHQGAGSDAVVVLSLRLGGSSTPKTDFSLHTGVPDVVF